METPVILSAVRTPVVKFQGGLSSFSAPELGGKVVAEAARRAGLDTKQIDEAILGNVVQAGLGQNPARQAALRGGCDPRVAAMTINKVCGSGLKAVSRAAWSPCPTARICCRRRAPATASVTANSWTR